MSVCFDCGGTDTVEQHHVIPRVLGGKATVPLCITCHGLVHGRDFVKSRNLQAAGIAKAKALGKFVGRKKGTTESVFDFIKKTTVKRICILRHTTNLSYRDIATEVGCSLSTVQKCYKKVSDDICERIVSEQGFIKPVNKKELQIIRLERKLLKLKNEN